MKWWVAITLVVTAVIYVVLALAVFAIAFVTWDLSVITDAFQKLTWLGFRAATFVSGVIAFFIVTFQE